MDLENIVFAALGITAAGYFVVEPIIFSLRYELASVHTLTSTVEQYSRVGIDLAEWPEDVIDRLKVQELSRTLFCKRLYVSRLNLKKGDVITVDYKELRRLFRRNVYVCSFIAPYNPYTPKAADGSL